MLDFQDSFAINGAMNRPKSNADVELMHYSDRDPSLPDDELVLLTGILESGALPTATRTVVDYKDQVDSVGRSIAHYLAGGLHAHDGGEYDEPLPPIFRFLAKIEVDFSVRDGFGRTVLHYLVDRLARFEHGDVYKRDGWPPGFSTAETVRIVVRELRRMPRTDLDPYCHLGMTPLHRACRHEYPAQVIDALVAGGADINAVCCEPRMCEPYMYDFVADDSRWECCVFDDHFFVPHCDGFALSRVGSAYLTPVCIAVISANLEAVLTLLSLGASLHVKAHDPMRLSADFLRSLEEARELPAPEGAGAEPSDVYFGKLQMVCERASQIADVLASAGARHNTRRRGA